MTRGWLRLTTTAMLLALGCDRAPETPQSLRVEGRRAGQIVAPLTPVVPAAAPALAAAPLEPLFQADYPAALARSQSEGKPLLLFFGAGWCLHSKRLAGELTADPGVAKLAREFLCVRIDVDNEAKLCEEFRVKAYPTLIIAAPGGAILQRLTGLQSAGDVAREMSTALTAVAERLNTPGRTLTR